jgi:hypothetical protein
MMSLFVFILSNCQAQNHAWAYWTGPDGGGRTGGRRREVDGARRRGPHEGANMGGGGSDTKMGGGRWGAEQTRRVYTLRSINNIWNLTNTIELKHLKTVANNKF